MKVDVSSWHFEYQRDTPIDRALRDYNPSLVPEPESSNPPNADALLRHLDGPGDADRSRFQHSIDERHKRDPDVATVMAARTPLKDLKHFRAYRGHYYDKYHNAARRIACGTGSEKDQQLTDGFDVEVSSSRILLEPGQILFHGRSNDLLITKHPYPSYVSATLNPIVALNSAYRRAGNGGVNGRPIVLVLEMGVPLRALLGPRWAVRRMGVALAARHILGRDNTLVGEYLRRRSRRSGRRALIAGQGDFERPLYARCGYCHGYFLMAGMRSEADRSLRVPSVKS